MNQERERGERRGKTNEESEEKGERRQGKEIKKGKGRPKGK